MIFYFFNNSIRFFGWYTNHLTSHNYTKKTNLIRMILQNKIIQKKPNLIRITGVTNL